MESSLQCSLPVGAYHSKSTTRTPTTHERNKTCVIPSPGIATVGLSIESANVVGYQNKAVRQYLSQQVCTFDQIGVTGGALNIQKLIPVDGKGNEVGGKVTVQFISSLGVTQTSYTYYKADGYDEGYAAG